MPNWCNNEVTMYADEETIKQLKAEVFTTDKDNKWDPYLDFNKVIPMPKELEDTISPTTVVSDDIVRMRDLVKAMPSIQSIWVAEQQIKADEWTDRYITKSQSEYMKKTYGADNWYDWKVKNWGTKWNIDGESVYYYDEDVDRIELHFDTAWSPPEEVCEVLRQNYDVDINWFYREDGMQFSGYL
tara:strand:+ start:2202 stop:2756 length:555 start_codon:yes stop_codon:yes gene_type:complete